MFLQHTDSLGSENGYHITKNFLVLIHGQIGAFGSFGQWAQLDHLLSLFCLHKHLLALGENNESLQNNTKYIINHLLGSGVHLYFQCIHHNECFLYFYIQNDVGTAGLPPEAGCNTHLTFLSFVSVHRVYQTFWGQGPSLTIGLRLLLLLNTTGPKLNPRGTIITE